jgi:hypothetical protein
MVYLDDDELLLSTLQLPLQGVAREYKKLSKIKEMDFMDLSSYPAKVIATMTKRRM